jgi:predicted patatin/cPLA2 family phospholipase
MKMINISGGAIKFIAMIACLRRLVYGGVQPKVVSGVSSGAMIAFLYVCGRLEEGYEMAQKSHDRRLIFSKGNDPVGKISGLSWSAIWKLIRGYNFIGVMDNLERNLRAIVSELDFEMFKNKGIDCWILSVDEKSRKQVAVNLRYLGYYEALDHVIGSSSIAPTIKARDTLMNGVRLQLNDGGHRDHSAGGFLLRNGYVKGKLNEVITIWSRLEPEKYKNEGGADTSTFLKRIMNFVISTFIRETSLNDEYMEKEECENKGMKYSPIYLDRFTSSTYDITEKEIEKGIKIGEGAADKYLKQ